MNRLLITLALFFASTALMADNIDPDELEPAPQPPDLPDSVESGEKIEPVITIKRTDDAVIEEYSINGSVYMVKVTPAVGPAYYLIDNNGDGELSVRRHELDQVVVPQWSLFRW